MPTFVLVGGPFEIYDSPFQGDSHLYRCTLGASFEMPDETAHRAIAEGAPLLPKASFDALGFSAEEMKKYPNAKAQAAAPAEFHEKLLAARIAVHDYRAQLGAKE